MENSLGLKNNSYEIFSGGCSYVNNIKLFYGYFNAIPNIKTVPKLDFELTKKWIEEEFKTQIRCKHFEQVVEKDVVIYNDLFYILEDKIIINLYFDSFNFLFDDKHEDYANIIINKVLDFKTHVKRTTKISLVITSKTGFKTKEIEIKKPSLTINLHYNDDFKHIHELVKKSLKVNKKKGLFLFHGLPGTGKSTYLKYLIHQQHKKVIFLSPKMAGNLDSASFTEFLLDNENCILVIEDAEELIVSRENNHNSHLSFLLNMTDGILADSLGIQIIATFNTDIQNIDKALLRKGRLTAIYEFKALEIEKANALFQHLKIQNQEALSPMTLADIYNFKEDNFISHRPRRNIGF